MVAKLNIKFNNVMKKPNGIWVTWERQRRNIGIASSLGWHLYEFDICGSRIIRYIKCVYSTIKAILKEQPNIVAVQNPSIVLTLAAILLSRTMKFKVIVDAHNSGLFPKEGKSCVMMLLARWAQRKADLTIVTNSTLFDIVTSNGGQCFILQDKIPDTPITKKIALDGRINIVYICTFSEDEPYQNIIDAASLLDNDITVYITGNYKNKISTQTIPDNIKLLGFVNDMHYWSVLNSADIIMDLTFRENCLVCGAYEAVSVCKPLILSDTNVLREYFNIGCVYVKPTVYDIVNGINDTIKNIDLLQKQILLLKLELIKEWEKKLINLQDEIDRLIND